MTRTQIWICQRVVLSSTAKIILEFSLRLDLERGTSALLCVFTVIRPLLNVAADMCPAGPANSLKLKLLPDPSSALWPPWISAVRCTCAIEDLCWVKIPAPVDFPPRNPTVYCLLPPNAYCIKSRSADSEELI